MKKDGPWLRIQTRASQGILEMNVYFTKTIRLTLNTGTESTLAKSNSLKHKPTLQFDDFAMFCLG